MDQKFNPQTPKTENYSFEAGLNTTQNYSEFLIRLN